MAPYIFLPYCCILLFVLCITPKASDVRVLAAVVLNRIEKRWKWKLMDADGY